MHNSCTLGTQHPTVIHCVFINMQNNMVLSCHMALCDVVQTHSTHYTYKVSPIDLRLLAIDLLATVLKIKHLTSSCCEIDKMRSIAALTVVFIALHLQPM